MAAASATPSCKPRASNSDPCSKAPPSPPERALQQPPLQPPSFTHVPKPTCSHENVPGYSPFLPSPGFSTLVGARSRPQIRCCCTPSPYMPSPFSTAVQFDAPKLHVCLFSSSASLVHRVKGQNKPAFPENRPAPAACRKRRTPKPGEERRKLQSNLPTAAHSPSVPQRRGVSQPHQAQPGPRTGVVGIRADPGRVKSSLPWPVRGYWANTSCQALPDGSCRQAGRGKPAVPRGTVQRRAQPRCRSQRRAAAVHPLGKASPAPLTCPCL